MKTNLCCCLIVAGQLLASHATSQANDLVDFLRLLQNTSLRSSSVTSVPPDHEGHRPYGYVPRSLTSRDIHKLAQQTDHLFPQYRGRGHGSLHHSLGGPIDRFHSLPTGGIGSHCDPRCVIRPPSTIIAYQISTSRRWTTAGEPPLNILSPQATPMVPPVPSLPLQQPSANVDPHAQALEVPLTTHQIGEIVDCPVPLVSCARVKDAQNIAPYAVPVVVAVRNPHQCNRECPDRIAFVQICVPPCSPRSIRISPCHTRLHMDFGKYAVSLTSRNSTIVVDYDD